MTWRMSRRQIGLIAFLAIMAGLLPLAIGLLFGFGAIVVAPVAMIVILIPLGAGIAHIAPTARWSGVALATFVLATTFVAAPAGLQLALNGRPMTMHVEVRPADFPSFTGTLQAVLKEQGGESGLTHVDLDDPKSTIHLLDASVGWIHIFASGRLVAKDANYPCSGRSVFTITAQPYLSFYGQPDAVYDRLEKALATRGYDVRERPFACDGPRTGP